MSVLTPSRSHRVALSSLPTYICQQCRHATLLRRPKRPYTFQQLVTLSDGSTYLHRTTSPLPVFRSDRDTRNSPLWNPSSQKLLNVEDDDAGRLRSFRAKFGHGWDAAVTTKAGKKKAAAQAQAQARPSQASTAPDGQNPDQGGDASSEITQKKPQQSPEDGQGLQGDSLLDLLREYAPEDVHAMKGKDIKPKKK